MDKIKLAILGCGRVFGAHKTAVNQNKDKFELIAVCDAFLTEEKESQIKEDFPNIKIFKDLTEMLETEQEIECVSVITPNGLHYEHVKEIIKHNKNVIVEKPLCIKYKDALELYKLAEKHKVKILSIYQNRFNPTVMAVHQAIEAGRLGKIYFIASNVFWHHKSDYYKKSKWHGTNSMDGGMFMTQASHYLDAMNWFAGFGIKKVYGNLKTLSHDIETEDVGTASIEWENGTLGTLNATTLTYNKEYEGSIIIIAEKGTIKIGGLALNEIEYWDIQDPTEKDEYISKLKYDTTSRYGFGHIDFYKNAYEVIKNNAEPFITKNQILESIQTLCKIKESNKKGKPLKVKI